MGNAGRVLMIPKGEYNSATTYEMLDFVYYQGRSYVCKQTSTGNVPTNTTYWQALTGDASAEIQALTNEVHGNWSEGGKNLFKVTASSQTLGSIVFTVNADGTISAVGASGDNYRQLNLGTITGIGGAVKLVGCPSGGETGQTYVLAMKNETTNTWLTPMDTGDGQQYELVANNTYSVNIIVYANNTVNLLFKPMVSKDLSVTYATYQPYAKPNVELTRALGGFELATYEGTAPADSTNYKTESINTALGFTPSYFTIISAERYHSANHLWYQMSNDQSASDYVIRAAVDNGTDYRVKISDVITYTKYRIVILYKR